MEAKNKRGEICSQTRCGMPYVGWGVDGDSQSLKRTANCWVVEGGDGGEMALVGDRMGNEGRKVRGERPWRALKVNL